MVNARLHKSPFYCQSPTQKNSFITWRFLFFPTKPLLDLMRILLQKSALLYVSELWGQNGGKRESSSFSKGISHKQQKLKRKSPVCIMWSFKGEQLLLQLKFKEWWLEKKKLFLEFQILIDDRRKLDNLSLELNFHQGEKLIWKIPHRSWVTPSADISTFEPLLNVEKWWIPFS